jgi:dTDP-glucose 4,6-dehydratase
LKGKKVLVTGGAGFIGSSLVRELLDREAEVLVYDNLTYGDMTNLEEVRDRIEIAVGDVLSWRLVEVMRAHKPNYVFHLAAEPYIPDCYDNPEKFIDVNVKGTLNVLMASKIADVERILNFSTSEVYGTAKYTPMDENHPTLPLSTYAVSKLAADRLCDVFSHEHKIPVVILRPFNAYGPRETQPYVIPEIIMQLARGRQVRLGNLKAKRDFTYVDDVVKGAIAVMESDIPNGDVVNLGSGETHSIEELAHVIARTMGREDIEVVVDKKRLRPRDVDLLQCNHSKIFNCAGWTPKITLEEGLKRTINWFMEHGRQWPWEKIRGTSTS